MALPKQIEAIATEQVWPGHTVQWTTGYARHCPPGSPHVDGVRVMIYNPQGRAVNAADAETESELLAKIKELHLVMLGREDERRRRATLSRASF